ncbi:MAG: hypothetical protein ACRCYQ_14045 [Nocardioides sp.]
MHPLAQRGALLGLAHRLDRGGMTLALLAVGAEHEIAASEAILLASSIPIADADLRCTPAEALELVGAVATRTDCSVADQIADARRHLLKLAVR